MVESDRKCGAGLCIREWEWNESVHSSRTDDLSGNDRDWEDGDPLDENLLAPILAESAPGAAFTLLVREMSGRLHAYATRRVEPSVAEELVADTFAVAWTKRESMPEERSSTQAWLFEILKRTIKDHHSTQYGRAKKNHLVANSLPREASDNDIQRGVVEQDYLASLMAQLPEDMTSVIELTAQGFKAREIAEKLGLKTTTVTSR